jgi:hypothetical protein
MKFNRFAFFTLLLVLVSFAACKEKNTDDTKEEASIELSQEEIQQYTEAGKTIAKATFTELSSNLKKALKEGGVKEAAEYCNIVAMPLTDSLSGIHEATIKRTSLKLRNPENKANAEELAMLKDYEAKFAAQQDLQPVVQALDSGTVQFYAPILTQQLCLSCHGSIGKELTQENYEIIRELYPEDKAIGYAEKDFRGMWSIQMKK